MYAALKILHVVAVVVFLGNLITGIFWKVHADQTKNPAIIRGVTAETSIGTVTARSVVAGIFGEPFPF